MIHTIVNHQRKGREITVLQRNRRFIDDVITSLQYSVPDAFSESLPHVPPITREWEIGERTGINWIRRYLSQHGRSLLESLEPDFKIEKEVKEYGIEALAWYRSYHWHPIRYWGIYIRLKGIVHVTRKLLMEYEGVLISEDLVGWLHLGAEILFHHEIFHFLTDCFATNSELVTRTPHYIRYIREIYSQGWDVCPEEALANRYVLEKIDQRTGLFGKITESIMLSWQLFREALHSFFINQPDGYRHYSDYSGNRFKEGRITLSNLIAFLEEDSVNIDLLRPQTGIVPTRDVPVYLVFEL